MCTFSLPGPARQGLTSPAQNLSKDLKDRARINQEKHGEITNPNIPIQETVKLWIIRAFDYLSYQSKDWLRHYDKLKSCNSLRILNNLRWRVRTHSFDAVDASFLLTILKATKLTYNAYRIHESAAIWAMSNFVTERVPSSLNSIVLQSDGTKGIATVVNSIKAVTQATN